MDGLTEVVSEFLRSAVYDNDIEHIEIEAKFGRFIDKGTNNRVSLPIRTETVLQSGHWYRFESTLDPSEHAHFNKILNNSVRPDSQWTYKHTKTVDTVLSGKLRVTQSEDKSKIIECMNKRRLADLAIYMPNRAFDVRISVNLELPQPSNDPQILQKLQSGFFDSERSKDRRSYFNPTTGIQYDLTEVRQRRSGDPKAQTSFELELEVKNVEDVLEDPSTFISSLRSFSKIH